MTQKSKECCICFETIDDFKTNKFNCIHNNFHDHCIRQCDKCPLCRSSSIVNNKRILIWNEFQRKNAQLYNTSNNLNCEIVVINSTNDILINDIMYHYSG